jgi:hypothetical protein
VVLTTTRARQTRAGGVGVVMTATDARGGRVLTRPSSRWRGSLDFGRLRRGAFDTGDVDRAARTNTRAEEHGVIFSTRDARALAHATPSEPRATRANVLIP